MCLQVDTPVIGPLSLGTRFLRNYALITMFYPSATQREHDSEVFAELNINYRGNLRTLLDRWIRGPAEQNKLKECVRRGNENKTNDT
jgi:hypothetical protein